MSCPNLTHYIATLTLLTVCLSVSGHSRRPTTADDILRSAEYQSEEHLSEAVVADLSKVLYNPDYEILGYEGKDFHRLRIHYTTIHRNHTDGGLYNITGALFRRNHSLPVQGTLRIRTMRKSKMPSTLGYQRYILAADVELFGPVRQSNPELSEARFSAVSTVTAAHGCSTTLTTAIRTSPITCSSVASPHIRIQEKTRLSVGASVAYRTANRWTMGKNISYPTRNICVTDGLRTNLP